MKVHPLFDCLHSENIPVKDYYNPTMLDGVTAKISRILFESLLYHTEPKYKKVNLKERTKKLDRPMFPALSNYQRKTKGQSNLTKYRIAIANWGRRVDERCASAKRPGQMCGEQMLRLKCLFSLPKLEFWKYLTPYIGNNLIASPKAHLYAKVVIK